jgi:hypothetical protein
MDFTDCRGSRGTKIAVQRDLSLRGSGRGNLLFSAAGETQADRGEQQQWGGFHIVHLVWFGVGELK